MLAPERKHDREIDAGERGDDDTAEGADEAEDPDTDEGVDEAAPEPDGAAGKGRKPKKA